MSGDVQALPWLLHGASFLALGLIGALLPRGVTLPRFADTCRAIARFGLLLGAAAWLVMLDRSILPGAANQGSHLASLRVALLAFAYGLLLRDGLRAIDRVRERRLDALALVAAAGIAAVGLWRPASNPVLEVAARYLIAGPGAALAAWGLSRGLPFATPVGRRYARSTWLAQGGLIAFALLTVVAAPAAPLPPASILNFDRLQVLGLSPPLLMGAAAVLIAIGLVRTIGAMRLETEALLAEARERLEARVAERTASLRQANGDLARQIAARERMEAAWHESEADLAITLHSLGEAVITTNSHGQVARMNPAAERLTGVSIEAGLGKRLGEILHLVDEPTGDALDGRLDQQISGTSPERLPAEALLAGPGGARHLVGLSLAPILHKRGDAERRIGNVLVLHDVADRRKLEERLRLSDRLVSLGTMAAGVAHEINNPLTYVTLNVDLVIKDLTSLRAELNPTLSGPVAPPSMTVADLGRRLAELLAPLTEAQEGASRVRRIVRDLKLFSRADDEALGRIDVRHTAEAACNMAWNEVRHRARLVKHFAEVVPVEANEARLGQVVLSLLTNAAQAIPEGRAERHQITVTTGTTAAGGVYIEVRDTGCGISPENLPRLFDPFFTTKPVGAGTGLGLAVCHGIVQGMGGQIVVDSEVGVGSVFRIELPAAKALAGDLGAAPSLPAEPARRARVLLVDDEVMILRTLRRSIGRDTDLVALTRAEEALELINGGERFDLILCDLMMPTMTGMELFEELTRAAPEQAERIVFVTGGAFTPAAQAFLASVRNPQLGKPVDLVELKALIQARLGGGKPPMASRTAA